MDRIRLLQLLFVLWLICMAWSAWSVFGMAATNDGLARGFNKIFGFLVGQAGAALVAILLLILGWQNRDPRSRWLARGPAVMSLLIVLALVGVATWSNMMRPDPQSPPPKPATAPVDVPAPAAD